MSFGIRLRYVWYSVLGVQPVSTVVRTGWLH